jgi:hypothetical protein
MVCLLAALSLHAWSSPGIVLGQQRSTNTHLRFEVARAFYLQHDELASPLRYSGSAMLYRVGVHRQGDARFGLTLGYAHPRLTSSSSKGGDGEEEGARWRLSTWYLRSLLRRMDDRLSFVGGGQVDLHLGFWDHVYTEGLEESFLHGIAMLEVAGGVEYRGASGRVGRYRIAVPLITAGLRPPYQGLKSLASPRVFGPGSAWGIDQHMEILFPMSSSVDLVASYRASFFQYPDPMRISVGKDVVGICLQMRFGGEG